MKNKMLVYTTIFILLLIIGVILGQGSRTGNWSQRAGIEIIWNIAAALAGFLVSLIIIKATKKKINETLNIIGWILVFLNVRFLITRPEMSIYSIILFIAGAILILLSYMRQSTRMETTE